LKHFPEKWTSGFPQKMRPNKKSWTMRPAIDIGPALLPWRRSAAEAYYGASREQIERALADLSCGFWRAAGVTPPRPSARANMLLRLGQAVHVIGLLCVLSLLPLAVALMVLAVMDRSEQAIAALIATLATAAGMLLVLPAMAMVHRAKRMLVRLPLDLAVRPASVRKARAGRLLERTGLALGLGFALIAAVAAGMLVAGDPAMPLGLPPLPKAPALLVFAAATLMAGTLLVVGGIVLFRRGLATMQPSGDELMASDRRRPVLLLRSFADERMSVDDAPTSGLTWSQMSSLARMEESIADQLRPFGPLVAIGKPGEALPQLGASRNYYADAEWQAAALELMREAVLIVVIAGVSAGLRWELEAIARAGHQSKLLVLMPEPHRQRRWDVLTQELRDVPGFDGLPREVPKGLLCMHASPGAGCTLLSAQRSGRIDYDTAIQLAIYGLLTSARNFVADVSCSGPTASPRST
jgi:hypothetical protein